jgi:dTDP-4-dehydrorhamnose 3,5-epimerase
LMRATPTAIPDVLLLEPRVFGDARGFFLESYNEQVFAQATGLQVHFVQDNHSRSQRHVLRGMHFQAERPQGKLVRVVAGAVFDVVVDIRRDSPTYGKWVGGELSVDNQRQVWIPPGLAHGFMVLSESADFVYKTTEYYHPASEDCLAWNDPTVAIDWPLGDGLPLVSDKDAKGLLLDQL